MPDDVFWEAFADTGEPLCWLMHRASVKEDKKSTEERVGDKPQALG